MAFLFATMPDGSNISDRQDFKEWCVKNLNLTPYEFDELAVDRHEIERLEFERDCARDSANEWELALDGYDNDMNEIRNILEDEVIPRLRGYKRGTKAQIADILENMIHNSSYLS